MRVRGLLVLLVAAWPTRAPAAERVVPEPLLWTHRDERVTGSLVAARLTRLYLNQGRRPIDSTTELDIPSGAVAHAARLTVGSRTFEARVRREGEAEVDPERTSLTIVEASSRVSLSVANLPPGTLVRVEIDTLERRANSDSCDTNPRPELLVDAGGHFLLTRSVHDEPVDGPRQIIFLLDRSASSAGGPFEASKDRLLDLIARLRPDDAFEILAFDHGWVPLFGRAEEASDANLARAVRFLANLDTGGGTRLAPALQQALRSFGASYPQMIVILTDGMVGDPTAALGLVRRSPAEVLLLVEPDLPHELLLQAERAGARRVDALGAIRALQGFARVSPRLHPRAPDEHEVSHDRRHCQVVTLGHARVPLRWLPMTLGTNAMVSATAPTPIAPLWARARMSRLDAAAQQKWALAHHLLTRHTWFHACAD